MKKFFALSLLMASSLCALGDSPKKGVVDMRVCFAESKIGKQEQAGLETLQNQLMELMQGKEKEFETISNQLKDQDFLDGLSPQGREEKEMEAQRLLEELNFYRQQFSRTLHDAQGKSIQKVYEKVSSASEKIAQSKGLTEIGSKENYFYIVPSMDITSEVIKVMDASFDVEKESPAPSSAETAESHG